MSNLSLDLVFPAAREQILTWHPNKVFFAVAHLLCERLSQTRTARRRVRGKKRDALSILKSWMGAGDFECTVRFSGRQRLYGRDLYRRIVSILTGRTARAVIQVTEVSWQELASGRKDSWAQLSELFKLPEVQQCAHEFLTDDTKGPRRVSVQRQSRAEEEINTPCCHGYGVAIVFNTPCGQDDVEVIRILQSGISGHELRTALKQVPCYTTLLNECWAHFEL